MQKIEKNTPKTQIIFSVIILLFANILVIGLALFYYWSLHTFFLVFWAQSLIIGFFYILKILDLKNFSTEGVKVNGKLVKPTKKFKKESAWFFLLHYGFVHFCIYFAIGDMAGEVDWKMVIIGSIIFFVNHCLSFIINRKQDRLRVFHIGKIMIFPYLRIFPMIILIWLALNFASDQSTLLFFLAFKIVADMTMHVVEHIWHGETSFL